MYSGGFTGLVTTPCGVGFLGGSGFTGSGVLDCTISLEF
ncbi:hypothetical protein DCF50_p1336 [Dehalobacter sp. CF]|nr:hypothetical protein DCF50_p1336 [Dehalobacter sp. CF]